MQPSPHSNPAARAPESRNSHDSRRLHDLRRVRVEDLHAEWEIHAITAFSPNYLQLDAATRDWLCLNFAGAKAEVQRAAQVLQCEVTEITVGDQLNQVYDFPHGFKRFSVMNEKLFAELKRRGFLEFAARPKANLARPATAKDAALAKGERLMEGLGKAQGYRDELSHTLETCFSRAGQGNPNVKDVANLADQILASRSSEAMTALATLKESEQTYTHCVDVGAIFVEIMTAHVAAGNQALPLSKRDLLLGGFLHDIGKGKVPKEIIESTKRFDLHSPEMQQIRQHPVLGRDILHKLDMPAEVIALAYHHHVKLDSDLVSSYPKEVNIAEVPFASQLLSLVDVYQALVGRRKYKKPWSAPEAIRYLDSLSGVEYGEPEFKSFVAVMGKYPLGSLVELNDGSQAFVVGQTGDAQRPQVALINNAQGERLSRNPVLDLTQEQDMKIVKDHHVDDVFGDQAALVFQAMNLC